MLKILRNDDTHFKNLTLNDCKKIKSRLYYRERKYVSTYHSLKLRFLKLHYNSLVDDHQQKINIYELLTRNYYWNEMQNFVRRYYNHCNVCRKSKSFRFKKQKVLRTLFISQRRWRDINIDLIIDFFEVNDYNVIVNIIDRLMKKRHHIFCNKIFDVEKLIILFMKHVWRYHELFNIIIFDWNFQFINDFWKKLCKRLNIEIKLFIIWHSKTNDQIEKLNDVMT